MLQLLITVAGVATDYSQCTDWSTVNIQESLNIPTQLTFSMYPLGRNFVVPPQRAYVQVWSTMQKRSLFSGFVAAAPTLTYLAKSAHVPTAMGSQLFRFDMTCVSDEYLLNVKAVPFIPAFINQGQGAILASIAELLCPGFFDTSMVASGDIIPFFQYSPNQSWCEIAKQFADGSRFRYHARDKQLTFQPYGDFNLGIIYDEEDQPRGQFKPDQLLTTVLNVPIVNDITIIGDTEAGNNHEDFFLGDGFTGNFPLLHQVFRGYSTVLLQESWNSGITDQNWYLNDPGDNFDFNSGALNLVDTLSSEFALGFSYLLMNNGLELAGGTDLQVGECIFEDYSSGILGGIYTDTSCTQASLFAGFDITTPSGVAPSASGVAGVFMQPYFAPQGGDIGPVVVSQINHSYVLQIVVTAPVYSLYTQIYRTVDGEVFGGSSPTVSGSITFIVQDYDIGAATGIFYEPNVTQFTVDNVELPAFAAFALVNNRKLNVSITDTTVADMPLGVLQALEGDLGLSSPTGLILPWLPIGSGGFIGTVPPFPAAASANIQYPPGTLQQPPQNLVMGAGYDLAAAQVAQGQSNGGQGNGTADTLQFFAQTLPAAGTPIRFQSYEAQAAVSRLQASGSIAQEAYVVGDNGIRSAIVSNLNPLPRTSEDCDNAALAFLLDRVGTFYNGTYTVESYYFNGVTSDVQFYPTCGRFLWVNAPRRGIYKQYFLVTTLTITVLDALTELVNYAVGFSADLFLEKVINNFVDLAPPGVLTPSDAANPPNPRFTQYTDNTYLPDLNMTTLDPSTVSGTTVTVLVRDNWPGNIEVRRIDSNWGLGQTPDLIGVFSGPQFTLPRQQFDQVWYMRPVANFAPLGIITSRRTKVLRVRWPLAPSQPLLVSIVGTVLQFNFNGDQRNIYGIEVRALTAEGVQVIVQNPVASYSNMTVDISQTPFAYDAEYFEPTWTFEAYFFNQGWVYSDPLIVTTPGVGQYSGVVTLNVPGVLAAGPNQAALVSLPQQITPLAVRMLVKTVPSPTSIDITINAAGNPWLTLALPAGRTEVDASGTQLFTAGSIAANSVITLDINDVGSSVAGSDLSVLIYY